MKTRAEHLAWCKEDAHDYLRRGDIKEAVTVMLCDLAKHPETEASSKGVLAMLGMRVMLNGDHEEARRFIDGFN